MYSQRECVLDSSEKAFCYQDFYLQPIHVRKRFIVYIKIDHCCLQGIQCILP